MDREPAHRPVRTLLALGWWACASAAVAVLLLGAGAAIVRTGAIDGPVHATLEPLPEFAPLAQRSVVYGRDGSVLATLQEEDRSPLPLEQIPQIAVDAVIVAEDAAFWEHKGIDLKGTGRAVVENARAGGVKQGGSTITQQLVKNCLLTSARSADRKINETFLAVRAERELGKREILSRYLNSVYFGEGAYGIQAAAERYFAKGAAHLDAGDAALLAGLIANPEGANPFKDPEAATERRDYVLRRMVEEGKLDATTADELARRPLPTAPQRPLPEPKTQFVEEVKRRLLDDPRLGATRDERQRQLFRGGLQIHTGLDPAMQSAAERAITGTVPASEFATALVAIDPATGEVRALADPRPFEENAFNLVTQAQRQPGSAFKAITLAAALEAGYSPSDTVDGAAPCTLAIPGDPAPWVVDNYDGATGSVMPLIDAIALSSNCAFARLVIGLGPAKVADMAKRLGFERPLPAVPSITLGTTEASPLELATVVSTLAADGVRRAPLFVTKVLTADGAVIFEDRRAGEQVVDPNVARATTLLLREVIARGTGTAANIGRPTAGKTGTSQEHRDAWFVGYTPNLAAAVWMGHPGGQVPMLDVGGIRVTGGSYPARVWGAFMQEATASLPPADFPPPGPFPPGTTINELGRGVPPPPPAPPPDAPPALPPPGEATPPDDQTPTTTGGGNKKKRDRDDD